MRFKPRYVSKSAGFRSVSVEEKSRYGRKAPDRAVVDFWNSLSVRCIAIMRKNNDFLIIYCHCSIHSTHGMSINMFPFMRMCNYTVISTVNRHILIDHNILTENNSPFDLDAAVATLLIWYISIELNFNINFGFHFVYFCFLFYWIQLFNTFTLDIYMLSWKPRAAIWQYMFG